MSISDWSSDVCSSDLPDWYREQARALPPEANGRAPQIPSTFRQRAFNTGRNGMASALMRPAFPFYRTHRPNSFLWETVGWFKKLNLRDRKSTRLNSSH